MPHLERLILSGGLRLDTAFSSSRGQLKRFATEANRILEMVDQVDFDFASQRARIPRLLGIESSSCHWSLFMVLDHLVQVDSQILNIVESLQHGFPLPGEVVIAEFKPDPDCDSTVVDRFQSVARRFQSKILEWIPLRTVVRFDHPWFGPLDARQWTALAAAHHRIHRRQAKKIITALGIT